ncbi:hypothetical protein ABGB08_17355, partial [Acrocarpospora sp. B8E8]
ARAERLRGDLPRLHRQPLDATRRTRRLISAFHIESQNLLIAYPERLALKLVSVAQLRIVEYPLSLSAIHEAMYWNSRDNADLAHQWLRHRIIDTARTI